MNDPTTLTLWVGWPLTEKLVQLAAYHCDVLKAREVPKGSNRGPWVDKYLAAAGAALGQPWCAAFVTYLLKECGYGHIPQAPAAVASWKFWALSNYKTVDEPGRGDLFFYLHANGTGHMGIVLSSPDEHGNVRTIEGNSNSDGSREGWEVVRHVRNVHLDGVRFIRL